MKKLYEKNQLTFSLIWVGVYVVLFSVADSVSAELGVEKIITAPVSVAIAVFLSVWICHSGLREECGLIKAKFSSGVYLYFLPLAVICSTNLWRGVRLNFTIAETILAILSMLSVGVIEEIIFRGFLFKALCKDNVRMAVAISSVTFGVGHIVNLLNGADVFSTLLQMCYATAIGFLFTIIFLKSGSLIPCIIAHGVVNSLSIVAGKSAPMFSIIVSVILIVLSLGYALWIIKKAPNK